MVMLYARGNQYSEYSVCLDKNNLVYIALGNLKPTDVKIIDQGLSRDDAKLLAKQYKRQLQVA